MEKASVDEMSKEIERKGIGTPATRAGIIEKLVRIGFIERKANEKIKNLIPTQKGISLITVVPELIQSASMTADWEEKLLGIEKGTYDSKEFMQEIEDMVTGLVKTYEVVKGADVIMNNKKVIGACPHCGSDIIQCQKGYFCKKIKSAVLCYGKTMHSFHPSVKNSQKHNLRIYYEIKG